MQSLVRPVSIRTVPVHDISLPIESAPSFIRRIVAIPPGDADFLD